MIKLFCIPTGGTPSTAFYKWMGSLNSDISLELLEYPARGMRSKEAALETIEELADDLYSKCKEKMNSCEYMLLSSCIGTIVEYEIYRRIVKNKDRPPKKLFAFSADSPTGESYRESQYISDKNREVLYSTCEPLFHSKVFNNSKKFSESYVDKMIELNRSSDTFIQPIMEEIFIDEEQTFEKKMIVDFANKTLMMLSDDWKMAKKYSYEDKEKLDIECPLTVVYGKNDRLLQKNMVENWKNFAKSSYQFIETEGGHNLTIENVEFCTKLINAQVV